MLRKIDKRIWVAEQPLRYLGLSIGTRMTVIQLKNFELLVISPIQMSDALVNHLNELGTVKHIIAPNLYHYLFTAKFKAIYSHATFWAAPGLELKTPNLPIDREITEGANNRKGEGKTIDREDSRLGFRSSDYGSWQYHRAEWQGGV
jgi:Domain of unknown function (DUF4336)